MRAVVTLLAVSGCQVPHTETDTSQLCLTPYISEVDGEGMEVAAGEPLSLSAYAYAGCHVADMEVRCEATVDGDTISVTTTYDWVRIEPLATNCEMMLHSAAGECTTPPLAAGTWTLEYAGDSLAFEVPGEVSGCLEGL